MESTSPKAPHVLVATDFSDAAEEALRQADAWARRTGAKLSVIHVAPDVMQLSPLFPQNAVDDSARQLDIERRATDALVEVGTRVTGRSEEDFKTHVRVGAVDAGVVRYAEAHDVDLIVVGATGRSGLERLWLGSTAERIVTRAHCSVLVARTSPENGCVLAATDLSDPALPAVRAAADEAGRRGAKLCVLHSLDVVQAAWAPSLVGPLGGAAVPVPPDAVATMRDVATQSLQGLTTGLQADIRVVEGNPAVAIDRAAGELPAELVVVATHGRTGLSRVALGSVAEKVVRAAPCSVLVVRR